MGEKFGSLFKTDQDEGKEKHVPVIQCPGTVSPGKNFEVKVAIGEEISHPNSWEHHIKWIQVFAHAEGQNPIHVGTFDLGPVTAEPKVKFTMKLEKSATLYVIGYCNIHGLWEASTEIKV